VRIGQGFDVHAFEPGRRLVLGGVHVPHTDGLKAHSDGDVLLHALCDALLGAAALGDIGGHFPDSDAAYAGADSRDLLRQVCAKLHARGLRPVNADITAIAQTPRLAPFIDAMRATIAADMQIGIECISVKATTTEQLGFTGRGEGIAALAVVLLEQPAAL
jgi:2-C-methyl-D-erythritol 2,4-cyclodiphosphate synthase